MCLSLCLSLSLLSTILFDTFADTVTKSCPIFLLAGLILMVSFIIFLIPTCSSRNHLYYFSAGILFIVSGELQIELE